MSKTIIWKTIPFFRTFDFWMGTVCSIVLFYAFYRHTILSTAIFMGVSFELMAFIRNVNVFKTTDTNLAVTCGHRHFSAKWEDIQSFRLNKSKITLKIKESTLTIFYIDRLVDQEAFLAFLESRIPKME